MENKRASQLISDNLNNIYGYTFARLYDKDDVDDLTQQIVYEVLRSADKIRDEEAFWGFLWKVAENTFRKFIKQKERRKSFLPLPDGNAEADTLPSPEEELTERESKNEELSRLRRELSLLSKTNRDVCVAYYFQNKSCKEIAEQQNLSLEMVKYHLFKTRKLLKEGIGMERTYGEKSYNPGVFRLNFWGDKNYYSNICNRKLPGSILLSAYYTPMTEKELSLELGVSMPYLEEEIKILTDAGLLLHNKDKYQTNLVILTKDFEKELENKTKDFFNNISKELFENVKELLPEIKEAYKDVDFDDNCLMISVMNIASVNAFKKANGKHPYGEFKPLPLGCSGFVWGHDNNYEFIKFTGISMYVADSEDSSWFSTENYKVFEKCSRIFSGGRFGDNSRLILSAIDETPVRHIDEKAIEELTEKNVIHIKDDIIYAKFPVFDEGTYDHLVDILSPVIEKEAETMKEYSDKAAELLAEHCPPSVRDQCGAITGANYRLNVAAIIFETLVKDGIITVPDEKIPITMWGVKK